MDTYTVSVPELGECDVLVIGRGSAGSSAGGCAAWARVMLVEQGYGRQLMLGGDMARRCYFVSYNGGPAALHDLLIDNPRRWLAFAPRADLRSAQ